MEPQAEEVSVAPSENPPSGSSPKSSTSSMKPASTTDEKIDTRDTRLEKEYFGRSRRQRRRQKLEKIPRFRLGDVVRDKVKHVRGVVIGWDEACQAPEEWRKAHYGAGGINSNWGKLPHYRVLMDLRDMGSMSQEDNLMAIFNETKEMDIYCPEILLEALNETVVLSVLMPQFMEFHDGSRYIPHKDLIAMYPDDVDEWYNKADVVTTPKGGPLHRVVEAGRLISHGAPVPVVRKGMFIVATPEIRGEIFDNSIVLLAQHDDLEGTVGPIVNKPMNAAQVQACLKEMDMFEEQLAGLLQSGSDQIDPDSIKMMLKEMQPLRKLAKAKGIKVKWGIGGPVGLEKPLPSLILHPFSGIRGAKLAVEGSGRGDDSDLFVGGDPLEILKSAKKDKTATIRLYRGVSSWGPNQLAGELRRGAWGWRYASPEEVHDAAVNGPGLWKMMYDNEDSSLSFFDSEGKEQLAKDMPKPKKTKKKKKSN